MDWKTQFAKKLLYSNYNQYNINLRYIRIFNNNKLILYLM